LNAYDRQAPQSAVVRTTLWRLLVLFLVLAVVFSIAAPIGFALHQTNGLIAAACGLAICGFAGLLAEIAGALANGKVLVQMLIGMALRMGGPLAACLAFASVGGPIVDAGVVYHILVFYLATLAIETGVSVVGLKQAEAQAS